MGATCSHCTHVADTCDVPEVLARRLPSEVAQGLASSSSSSSGCGGCGVLSQQPPRREESEWPPSPLRVGFVVRAMSGSVVMSRGQDGGIAANTEVKNLVQRICLLTGARPELVCLVVGTELLKPGDAIGNALGDVFGGASRGRLGGGKGPLEFTLVRFLGPAFTAEAMSRLSIKVLDHVPAVGSRCHCDRDYTFRSLGGFAGKPGMHYVLTSNSDKQTPTGRVMWRIDVRRPCTIYLNFRSREHVMRTGALAWLTSGLWEACSLQSTVSTGVPNGPYSGPVYSNSFDSGVVDLMGSNCQEGTYFVFVEIQDEALLDFPPKSTNSMPELEAIPQQARRPFLVEELPFLEVAPELRAASKPRARQQASQASTRASSLDEDAAKAFQGHSASESEDAGAPSARDEAPELAALQPRVHTALSCLARLCSRVC